MSTLRQPSSSKSSWWSRSKSAKDLPALQITSDKALLHSSTALKSGSSSKFNTLVHTAIGKRSRKPTLTIQEPPPSISLQSSSSFTSRSGRSTIDPTPLNSPNSPQPLSADFGTTLHYYDFDQASDFNTISEPRTPSDHPRDRSSYPHSVLTLSDPDPFASGAILFSPFAQDINRSSVYSDNSLLDPNSKRPDTFYSNISYGSSSSNSHSNPSDGARSVRSSQGGRSMGSRGPSEASSRIPERHRRDMSAGVQSIQVSPTFMRPPRNGVGLYPSAGSSSSHSTVTERNRRSTPSSGNGVAAQPRSNLSSRPRGMTVGEVVRPNTASGGLGFGMVSGMSPGPLRRKVSETFCSTRTPSSTSPPISSSPITFTRTRTSSTDTNSTTFPISATSPTSRPVVLVRKASSSRLLVLPMNAAPPDADLPPTPSSFGTTGSLDSMEDLQSGFNFPEPPSSSASSLSFASQIDLSDFGGDAIHHFMADSMNRTVSGPYPDISPSATVKSFRVAASPSSSKLPSPMVTTPQKTLKKALSQSSLLGKRYSATSVASSILSTEESVPTPSKAPKKQRSFHHTRIPLPPLPSLRHTSSHTSSTTSPHTNESPTSSQFPTSDQKKPSTAPHTRKRLFSGSSLRRDSQSQQRSSTTPSSPDDDVRSTTSMDSTTSNERKPKSKPIMMSFATFGNHVSLVTENACIAPSWDEQPPPPRRESQSEYVPQYIMSPEAMLKLEEELTAESKKKEEDSLSSSSVSTHKMPRVQLAPEDLGLLSPSPARRPMSARSRTNSTLSGTSTISLAHRHDDTIAQVSNGLSPRSRVPSNRSESRSVFESESARFGFRPNSASASPAHKPPTLNARPSTSQSSISPPSSPNTIRSHSPERPITALPPPPRPRPSREMQTKEPVVHAQHLKQPSNSSAYTKRMSVIPVNPLPPPPRRKNSETNTIASTVPAKSSTSRERPGLLSRPPGSFDPQKIMQRRSIMKKPSFLEIDDEMSNDEMENLVDVSLEQIAASPPMESSFLDLDRSSFDSWRSDDDPGMF